MKLDPIPPHRPRTKRLPPEGLTAGFAAGHPCAQDFVSHDRASPRPPAFRRVLSCAALTVLSLGFASASVLADPIPASADRSSAWSRVPGSRYREAGPARDYFDQTTLAVSGGTIDLAVSSGERSVTNAEILAWVGLAARAVSIFYGRFPVPHLTLIVFVSEGAEVNSGVEFNGSRIVIHLGGRIQMGGLADDWELTHEMFHLGFPQVPRRYHWMEEGLSTYLEPNARARAGQLTPEKVWTDLVEGLPQGLPQPGDGGLIGTRAWGRTYWGGALFWLMADVEIRARTHNARSLDDAIRAIWRQGGDGSASWPVEQILRVGDAATGTTVLAELHEKMGRQAEATDLAALWHRLGIVYRAKHTAFDDTAPLADVRAAITARETPVAN